MRSSTTRMCNWRRGRPSRSRLHCGPRAGWRLSGSNPSMRSADWPSWSRPRGLQHRPLAPRGRLCEQIARGLDLNGPDLERLRLAAEVHDIGVCLALRPRFLNKPGSSHGASATACRSTLHAVVRFWSSLALSRRARRCPTPSRTAQRVGLSDRLNGEQIPLSSPDSGGGGQLPMR